MGSTFIWQRRSAVPNESSHDYLVSVLFSAFQALSPMYALNDLALEVNVIFTYVHSSMCFSDLPFSRNMSASASWLSSINFMASVIFVLTSRPNFSTYWITVDTVYYKRCLLWLNTTRSSAFTIIFTDLCVFIFFYDKGWEQQSCRKIIRLFMIDQRSITLTPITSLLTRSIDFSTRRSMLRGGTAS